MCRNKYNFPINLNNTEIVLEFIKAINLVVDATLKEKEKKINVSRLNEL